MYLGFFTSLVTIRKIMSSSVPPDGDKPNPIFKGRVLHTGKFSTLCTSDTEVKKIADAFKQYWLDGYHPDIGKNAAFARPKEILNLNVRHAHCDNKDYTPENNKKDINGKKSTWDAWKNIGSVKVTRVPTSDSFLIYSVNHNRDALVMFFISTDAHSATEVEDFTESAISISYEFFSQTKTSAMPLDEDLFSEKWKYKPD